MLVFKQLFTFLKVNCSIKQMDERRKTRTRCEDEKKSFDKSEGKTIMKIEKKTQRLINVWFKKLKMFE